MSPSNLFVIGLDSVDKDLIEQWAATEDLPTFRTLLDGAIQGDIENPHGLEAGACWPAFYFGRSPAETSQFDGARHFDGFRYDHVSFRPDKTPHDAIWTTLSRAGKRCAVFDAPYSFPTGDINGLKVIDRGAHVPAGGGDYMEFRTHPPALATEINRLFGADPAGGHSSDFFPVDTAHQVAAFRDTYLERIENKTDMVLHYWRNQPFQFFMTVFTEAHCAGHRCWHIHDRSAPGHDAAVAAAVGDPLKDIYIALDRAVGRIIGAVRDNARVVVYLSHGIGPGYSGTRLLDRILTRLDDFEIATQSSPAIKLVRGIWRGMPDVVRRPLKPLRKRVSRDGFQPNRKDRRFFEVFANDRTGGIRINLAGREAHGIVQPGDEYETVCAQLTADLREVKNAETGEPLAVEIVRTRDYHSGDYLDYLPDILVTWNRTKPINAASSPKIGTVDKTGLVLSRSGDHRPTGRFFAVADDWPRQRLNDPVDVKDFVPTFAALLGVAPPATEGQVIPALRPEGISKLEQKER